MLTIYLILILYNKIYTLSILMSIAFFYTNLNLFGSFIKVSENFIRINKNFFKESFYFDFLQKKYVDWLLLNIFIKSSQFFKLSFFSNFILKYIYYGFYKNINNLFYKNDSFGIVYSIFTIFCIFIFLLNISVIITIIL